MWHSLLKKKKSLCRVGMPSQILESMRNIFGITRKNKQKLIISSGPLSTPPSSPLPSPIAKPESFSHTGPYEPVSPTRRHTKKSGKRGKRDHSLRRLAILQAYAKKLHQSNDI